MVDIDKLDPAPLRFGQCLRCPYLQVGSSLICSACASRHVEPVAQTRCWVCDQPLPKSGRCFNYWCNKSEDDRYFRQIFAIAMFTGALHDVVIAYKYRDVRAWASILGRVLAGYLDAADDDWFSDFDLIVPSPTYQGAGARRSWDHIRGILSSASQEVVKDWPFDNLDSPVIIKTKETTSLTGQSWARRRELAENEIRSSLIVPAPGRVKGMSILVFDDVFTDGSTLREVARALQRAGANAVSQVVLARQPWRTQP